MSTTIPLLPGFSRVRRLKFLVLKRAFKCY
uniref:Uncharacterized protein n=1 Tax=Arundo donax TaxID=35708 RepID=A0A0A9ANF1_ARUDO